MIQAFKNKLSKRKSPPSPELDTIVVKPAKRIRRPTFEPPVTAEPSSDLDSLFGDPCKEDGQTANVAPVSDLLISHQPLYYSSSDGKAREELKDVLDPALLNEMHTGMTPPSPRPPNEDQGSRDPTLPSLPASFSIKPTPPPAMVPDPYQSKYQQESYSPSYRWQDRLQGSRSYSRILYPREVKWLQRQAILDQNEARRLVSHIFGVSNPSCLVSAIASGKAIMIISQTLLDNFALAFRQSAWNFKEFRATIVDNKEMIFPFEWKNVGISIWSCPVEVPDFTRACDCPGCDD